jgi:hypothetical protein
VAALASGAVLVPSSAQAQPDGGAPVPASTCRPGDVTSADRALADQLRSSMNGRRLGALVSGRSIACARIIVRTVQSRGLGARAAVIAVTTAIAESTLNNHLEATDHDSLGLFQQRPSQGWGSAGELVDPVYATRKFLSSMTRKYPGGSWMTGDIGAICQRVQISAYPGAYAPEVHDAALIVAGLWSVAQPGSAQTGTKAATPTGPFQRTLSTAGTELGALDGPHALTLADWNGDHRLDLVVVKGAGTSTGKTEVRIMDGARNFSSMLLNTATAIGPADGNQAYAVADWNGDNKPDLVVVQKAGTASGHTEVRVVDGASYFQRLLAETATVLGPADAHSQFSVTDWNADGHPDLVSVQTAGTASKKIEVQVLDGAANLQRLVQPAMVTPEPVGEGLQAAVTDWNGDRRPDLVTMRKAGTTAVHVLDGASGLRRYVLSDGAAPVAADDRHELLVNDSNGDGRQDLVVVQKSGTATGRAEVSVLGG